MTRTFQRILIASLLLVLAQGCVNTSVGDACATNQDCGSGGAICDITAPDGYCTFNGCDRESCPQNSFCVEFDDQVSFCMQACQEQADCREGYSCIPYQGDDYKYCYVD